MIRLDHFRAFAAAWHVPVEAKTAQTGKWVAGPGADFFYAVQRELGTLPFIAEDLGLITPDVYALRDQFQLPGMRVLQFAFDGKSDNPYLPHNYNRNTVVYTGTHDNPTTREWFEELPDNQRQSVWNYLKLPPGESGDVSQALMNLAWSSVAALSMAPLAGFAEPGARGSDEHSRPCRRQLELALHGRPPFRSALRMAARSDEKLGTVGDGAKFARSEGASGGITKLNAIVFWPGI